VHLTVTDTLTGEEKTYVNPPQTKFEPIQDTSTFGACSLVTASNAAMSAMQRRERAAVGELLARARQRAAAPSLSAAGCTNSATALCLNAGRFQVSARYDSGRGNAGTAQVVQLTSDTGYLWFFGPSNVEVVVKVLNGCAFNHAYWVFAGGLTNVNVVLDVTDTWTGESKRYTNAQGVKFEPVQDVVALPVCP